MKDRIFEDALKNLAWSLLLFESGIKLVTEYFVPVLNVIGYLFIAISVVSIIKDTIAVPIIKSRS